MVMTVEMLLVMDSILKECNNYVDKQRKSIPVRFIMFLCTHRYNSLDNPTRQYKVLKETFKVTFKTKKIKFLFTVTL